MRAKWDPILTFTMIVMGIALLVIGPSGKLDAKLWYSVDEAKTYFQGLSADDRMTYFWGEFLDYLFMLNYTLLIYSLYKKLVFHKSHMSKLAFLPGAVDFLETICIQLILGKILPEDFRPLPLLTFFKWSCGFFVVTSLLQLYFQKKKITRS